MLLDNTSRNNLLVQACKLYLSCEYITCALTSLAYFTYKIGMPFLNMVEKSSQRDLKNRLPKLYEDLVNKNVDCLSEYHVEWKRVKVIAPDSALEKYIFDRMLEAVAEGLKIQRGREYGFSDEVNTNPRATVVSDIDDDELYLIPSNNLICERELSKFSNVAAKSARSSNRNFQAKSIRDDMALYKSRNVEKVNQDLRKILDEREIQWQAGQKKLQANRLEELMEIGRQKEKYIDKVVEKCKGWGGPILSAEELSSILVHTKDEKKIKNILRTEITYQKHTHASDARRRKELYLINKQETAALKYNLTLLLSDNEALVGTSSELFLPTEAEIIDQLNIISPLEIRTASSDHIKLNEPHAIVWMEKSKPHWYVGFSILVINDTSTKIEHLHRESTSSNTIWHYPRWEDIQVAENEQILPVNVVGEWDYSNENKHVLILKNEDKIQSCFEEYTQ